MLPGLLGIGTGAILVPVFNFVFRAPMQIAVGSSLACFSINAFLSSTFKLFQGFIDFGVTLPLCAGTLIGANIGAILNKKFPSPLLKVLFGLVFVVISGKYVLLFIGS
jgi:uncharacterized membrane protein YfcA